MHGILYRSISCSEWWWSRQAGQATHQRLHKGPCQSCGSQTVCGHNLSNSFLIQPQPNLMSWEFMSNGQITVKRCVSYGITQTVIYPVTLRYSWTGSVTRHIIGRTSRKAVTGHIIGRTTRKAVTGHIIDRTTRNAVAGHIISRTTKKAVTGHITGRTTRICYRQNYQEGCKTKYHRQNYQEGCNMTYHKQNDQEGCTRTYHRLNYQEGCNRTYHRANYQEGCNYISKAELPGKL